MKNVLLIGLGRFGRHMAQKLTDMRHQVLVIDKDERKVQEAMGYVTNAEIGDATDPALIDSLGVKDFDLCVVTMSHDLQASLEITALLKEKGAPYVLVRVSRDTHARFLLACGADEIIYPEKEMADWAAVRYSGDHVYDYTRLSPDHAIYEELVRKYNLTREDCIFFDDREENVAAAIECGIRAVRVTGRAMLAEALDKLLAGEEPA